MLSSEKWNGQEISRQPWLLLQKRRCETHRGIRGKVRASVTAVNEAGGQATPLVAAKRTNIVVSSWVTRKGANPTYKFAFCSRPRFPGPLGHLRPHPTASGHVGYRYLRTFSHGVIRWSSQKTQPENSARKLSQKTLLGGQRHAAWPSCMAHCATTASTSLAGTGLEKK